MRNGIDSMIKIDEWELAERIEKAFRRYKINMEVTDYKNYLDRVIFKVKLKGETRETQLLARLSDVQLRLKLPLFQTFKVDFNIYIVASDHEMVYDHLPQILCKPQYIDACQKMLLPYVVGYDTIGRLIIVDLSKLPHLLVAGATNSGKTVGLQALITSILYRKHPSRVNLILIDVGAANLLSFDGTPHLSCPVIRERNSASLVLKKLVIEMERRITIQSSDYEFFKKLPRLVLVVDEFPALFMGVEDRRMVKLMTDAISALLQRGRHAKIHVVLAAQNPTMQNMKVDLGNITGRVAFKCAKKNFSETIIGTGGAENLSGKGDMLFQSPMCDQVQRIQGVFISPNELEQLLFRIRNKWRGKYDYNLKFTINTEELPSFKSELADSFSGMGLISKQYADDRLLTRVLVWTLGQEAISCNALMKNFGIGWNRANDLMVKLYDLQIVENLDAKLPRKVLPQMVEDLPEKIISFLRQNGISQENIVDSFKNSRR